MHKMGFYFSSMDHKLHFSPVVIDEQIGDIEEKERNKWKENEKYPDWNFIFRKEQEYPAEDVGKILELIEKKYKKEIEKNPRESPNCKIKSSDELKELIQFLEYCKEKKIGFTDI